MLRSSSCLDCRLEVVDMIVGLLVERADGALLARRFDLHKSLYFSRKFNDFRGGGLFARRFARSMSIVVPCAPHRDSGSRCSEARWMRMNMFSRWCMISSGVRT